MTRPYFAQSASWNRTASALGAADSTYNPEFVKRLLNHGGGPNGPQRITPMFREYSIPIYDAAEAKGQTARAYQSNWAMAQQSFISPLGITIPWSPTWQPAPGNDHSMIIVDEAKGEVWELWGVDGTNIWGALSWPNIGNGLLNGFGTKVVMASCNHYLGLWTGTDGTVTSIGRGMGTHKLVAGPVRAAEVADGRIDHALSLLVANPMFGPMAKPPVGNTGPGAGYSTGFYCRPATRLEHANPATLNYGGLTGQATDANRAISIPSGMRFALRISDAEIDMWLDSRRFTGALRTTARIFAVALREYGMIVADTCGAGMLIETDGLVNPVTRALWAKCGIIDTGNYPSPYADLLDGLTTADRLYVVAMPAT